MRLGIHVRAPLDERSHEFMYIRAVAELMPNPTAGTLLNLRTAQVGRQVQGRPTHHVGGCIDVCAVFQQQVRRSAA